MSVRGKAHTADETGIFVRMTSIKKQLTFTVGASVSFLTLACKFAV